MTTLVPMRPETFAAFVPESVAAYAADNVAVGRWPEAGALERSAAEFASLLPQGLATPDHYLFEIEHESVTVGHLWLAVEMRDGLRSGFVYDVAVAPAHQRRGHGRRAFQALEALAREMGLASLGLHVFGHNPGAQALYAGLGFRVTGLNMVKPLAPG